MEQLHTPSVLNILNDYLVENFKPLVLLIVSVITAHSPVDNILHYDWLIWMPFLEVVKTILSMIAIVVSIIMFFLNYYKKKNS
jgi:hypothetical protein